MMHPTTGEAASASPPTARRIIFVRVGTRDDSSGPAALFAIGAVRQPQFYVDVEMHTLTLLGVTDLGSGTGWGRVPTPMF
jgi:hypothetical protein